MIRVPDGVPIVGASETSLMGGALAGSLTLMSILVALIGVLYTVYLQFCIPSQETKERPPICGYIRNAWLALLAALFISAATALFSALGLVGYSWAFLLARALLFLIIVLVPFVVLFWVVRSMP